MKPPGPARRYRVAMVCSHAIQYFMPWFRQLAGHPRVDLTVLLGDEHGLRGASFDPGFGRAVRWDIPLLDGLSVQLLRNHAPRPGVGRFLGIVNLGLFNALSPARFDAVVIQGWNYALYPLALLAARRHRLPVLLRGESPLLSNDPLPAKDRTPKGRLKHLILTRYLSLCAGALAVSSGNRRLLLGYGVPPERVFLSPYAVDGERFALPPSERRLARERLRAELHLPDDLPLVLSVGKLQPVKDPGALLAAHARLRAQGTRAALAFVGDGELLPSLQAAAQGVPDVHFLGFRNQTELPALYAAADVFVLPSVRETFGLVVNEAMHAGLPVVCSDGVGCAEDLVLPGRTGQIFSRRGGPEEVAAALAGALAPLLTGPDAGRRQKEMGERARAHVRTWTFAEATAGLLAALDAVVPPPRRPGDSQRSHACP